MFYLHVFKLRHSCKICYHCTLRLNDIGYGVKYKSLKYCLILSYKKHGIFHVYSIESGFPVVCTTIFTFHVEIMIYHTMSASLK